MCVCLSLCALFEHQNPTSSPHDFVHGNYSHNSPALLSFETSDSSLPLLFMVPFLLVLFYTFGGYSVRTSLLVLLFYFYLSLLLFFSLVGLSFTELLLRMAVTMAGFFFFFFKKKVRLNVKSQQTSWFMKMYENSNLIEGDTSKQLIFFLSAG